MWLIIIVLLVVISMLTILGTYRIRLYIAMIPGDVKVHFRITAWQGIYGLEWIRFRRESTWGCILFKRVIKIPNRESRKKQESGKSERQRKRGIKPRARQFFSYVKTDWIHLFNKSISALFKSFTLESMDVEALLGTGNPALTGEIFGLIQTISLFTSKVKFSMVPEFTTSKFEGKFLVKFRFVLACLLWRFMQIIIVLLSQSIYRKCRLLMKGEVAWS